MAQTDFASMNGETLRLWRMETEKAARDASLVMQYVGASPQSCFQLIKPKGTPFEVIRMHLVADIVGDGVINDNQRRGNEAKLDVFHDEIRWDIIAMPIINTGKFSDATSVVNFREQVKDNSSYWLANRIDQLAILTLSGISYAFNNDGSTRTDTAFSGLRFAPDVRAPSSLRHIRALAGGTITTGNTAAVTAADILSYNTILNVRRYANRHYIKPMIMNGKEYFMMFISPEAAVQLKQDANYQRAITTALPRDMDNPFFRGNIVTTDGIIFVEHRLVYTTLGAASGSKWGAGGTVDGSRALLLGAQSLGMLDLDVPEWSEQIEDYGKQNGICVDKKFGLLKPRYYSIYDKSVQDFGVLAVDHAIAP